MTDDIRQRASRAVAWVGAASAIVAAVDAVALVILLKLWVTTEELGTATLATTLFYFLDLVTEQGLGTVLIQRDKLSRDDESSLFWLNAAVSVVAFLAMFGLGPLVGQLQGNSTVAWMLLAYSTKLLYQNVYFIPMGILRRELRFKELSIIRTVANFGDVAGRIGFAAAGEPVWCFVAGPLIRVVITGIGCQICHPWRPRLVCKLDEARAWFSFAGKTMGTWYLTHLYTNGVYQVVGYFFGEAATGLFRIAYEVVLFPVFWVTNVVQQVAFPAFARLRNDKDALAAQFIRFSRQNVTTVLLIVVVVIASAPDLLAVAFPTAEHGAAIARILCVVGLLRAFDSLYVPLLDGLGWAGRNLLVAGIATVVLLGADIGLSVLLRDHGPVAVAIGRVIGFPIVIALHGYIVLSTLKLSVQRYVRELGGLVACGLVASLVGGAVWYFLPAMAPGLRLAIEAGASVGTLLLLLARFERITPRSIVAELRRT